MRWYWRLRKRLARWIPDPVQGVGFGGLHGDDAMNSGEVGLMLDVEGRTGVTYLSKSMWAQIGATAGWCTQEEADAIWDEETKGSVRV